MGAKAQNRIRAFALVRMRGIAHWRLRVSEGNHTMNPLITDEESARLLANGRTRVADQAFDPLPVVRLFTPDAHATWLLAWLDPADGDTATGVMDVGIGMPKLGEIKLSDLASIVGPNKQPVMRDRYFKAVRPL